MLDFDELEVQSPSVENVDVPTGYRGEDAHERFRLAELKIVQENVRRIEDDTVIEDDDDDEGPDGQFSDTKDKNATNAPIVPGCRADKARIRKLIRCRVHPERIPSSAWLEPEEETTTIHQDASRVVLSPADQAGVAETQEETLMRRRNRLQKTEDRRLLAVSNSATRQTSKPIGT